MMSEGDDSKESAFAENRQSPDFHLVLLVLLDLIAIGLLFRGQSQWAWYIVLAIVFFIQGVISGIKHSSEKSLKSKYYSLFFRRKNMLKLLLWSVIGPIVCLILKFDFQNQIGFMAIIMCIIAFLLIVENLEM